MKTPTHAERARTLVAMRDEGALSTVARDPSGHPYGSHVIYAGDESPILLLSGLAEHTKNLEADPRASLLVVEAGDDEALARARVTLVGRCRRVGHDVRPRFLERHPSAASYVQFADFDFWELAVESARYVGGFGRMSWIGADDWEAAEVDPLAGAAAGILAHMNEDHADACVAYARAFAGIEAAQAARMIAVDRYGFELAVETPEGPRSARLAFDSPVESAQHVRKALVAMVRAARER